MHAPLQRPPRPIENNSGIVIKRDWCRPVLGKRRLQAPR